MIKIQIVNSDVRELKGTSMKSGTARDYHMRFQTAYAYPVDPKTGAVAELPDKFEIQLEKDDAGYARGTYMLSPGSIRVSREGRMELVPRLVPVAPAVKS